MNLKFQATTTFCEGLGDPVEDVEITPGKTIRINDESTYLRSWLALGIQAHNHKNCRVERRSFIRVIVVVVFNLATKSPTPWRTPFLKACHRSRKFSYTSSQKRN